MLRSSDRELVRLLEENARRSTADLARQLNVSRSTVQNRIERLEEAGVIAGYTIRFGPAADRERVRAHVMIRVEPDRNQTVKRAVLARCEIRSLYSISGEYDMIAVIHADSTHSLDVVLDEIRDIEGVIATTTSILLAALMNR